MKKLLLILSIITNVLVFVGIVLVTVLFVGAVLGHAQGNATAKGLDSAFFILLDIIVFACSLVSFAANLINFIVFKTKPSKVFFIFSCIFLLLSLAMFATIMILIKI